MTRRQPRIMANAKAGWRSVVAIRAFALLAVGSGAAAPLAAEPAGFQEAMKSLRTVRSVSEGGARYQDYAPRTLEAKIAVDEYLRAPERNDADIRRAVGASLRYYLLTSRVWNAIIVNSNSTTREMAVLSIYQAATSDLESCPGVKKTMSSANDAGYGLTSAALRPLLECASAELVRAEKLTRGQTR
jgi:hypothetical protein